MMQLFSRVDPVLITKYRWLGPFALLLPGVLQEGGIKYLVATACGAVALFGVGLIAFDMTGVLSI